MEKNKFLLGELWRKYWAGLLVGVVFLVQCIIMLVAGEHVYASIHDNLDLHVLDLHLLSENDLFFVSDGVLPKLDGISRDYFFSEWSAYSWLYMLLPTEYAYITGYLLKTVMGTSFFLLLAKHVLKERYYDYRNILWIAAFAFGSLPLYSVFAWYFTSIPLVIYLLIRIYETPSAKWYATLFFYPLLSYFSFFGIFILGYLVLATIWCSVHNKKICYSLFGAVVVLALGYVVMEYRLFGVMLFNDTVTIRDTMVMSSWDIFQVLEQIGVTFSEGIFHADACQKWLVMPISLVAFVAVNMNYICKKEVFRIAKEPLNFVLAFILFNCIVYGFYGYEPARSFIERLIPVIKGLQLNRTVFFNTFLWYAALAVVLMKIKDCGREWIAIGIGAVAVIIVFLSPGRYNDFYNTCFNHMYELVKGTESNNLDFSEYYSTDLMESIKEDIDYSGEKCVAFGLNPAVLEYSNIWTLDGCISYYTQEYKEEFRKLIAPALDKNESSRAYFDDWGARAYIYSASDEDIYSMLYHYEVEDKNLYMDIEQFEKMGGTYIFSRIELTNAGELGLNLRGIYEEENSPYVVYLYEL